ncbi:flagellar hook protein FlgL [Gordoniibacillus kamchatkensis]|uniref:Flagellar hook protein FlgL n=1 Tax=Gordoniibacillus kamchatkensis TaxID=1590651 RepID=A0ABR5AHY3_9BACL|nr:flagellar hook-associated protein FlgL [Paenibacillus sp. VKM B-2647]KIL40649.1 flagellar hook protein FlgL [Paenibacillus sp. VKM B-2647]
MPLRVTNSMLSSQLLRNVNNNLNRLEVNQDILSTGKKINKPGDDPVGITYALRYRSELSMNDQYQKNIDTAKSLVDHTDTVLGQINDLFQRATELTTQGLNGTNPQSALNAIATELGQIYDQAVVLGNDQLNGKYIFNGQKTDQKPYSSTNAAADKTDTAQISYQFAAGVTIPTNVTGDQVFGPQDTNGTTDNLFTVLKGLQNAFANGDKTSAAAFSDKLKTRMDKFLNVRAEVGARSNRIDLMDSRMKDLNVNLTSLDSKVEDADIAETITKLKADENVYQASLSVGAKVIQPTLIDYLR